MTECSQTLFPFEAHFPRQVVAQSEGSWLTTEGGSLLLRQADRKIGLRWHWPGCISHTVIPPHSRSNFADSAANVSRNSS